MHKLMLGVALIPAVLGGCATLQNGAGPTATQALASNQSADSEFSGGIVLQPGSAVAQT